MEEVFGVMIEFYFIEKISVESAGVVTPAPFVNFNIY